MSEEYEAEYDQNCYFCEYDNMDNFHEKCEDCLKHTKIIRIRGTKDNFKLCWELRKHKEGLKNE